MSGDKRDVMRNWLMLLVCCWALGMAPQTASAQVSLVSTPAPFTYENLELLGQINAVQRFSGIATHAQHLYFYDSDGLSNYYDGFSIVDCQDPTSPTLVNRIGLPDLWDEPNIKGIVISDNLAYVLVSYWWGAETPDEGCYVQIYDVSNPKEPRWIKDFNGLEYDRANRMFAADQGVCIQCDTDLNILKIKKIDANSVSAKIATRIRNLVVNDLAVRDHWLFILDNDSLRTFDSRTTGSLTSSNLPRYPINDGQPVSIALDGELAYVICVEPNTYPPHGSLKILDLSNPLAPSIISSLTFSNEPFDIKYAGGLAYLSFWSYDMMLYQVYDVSDPLHPVRCAQAMRNSHPYGGASIVIDNGLFFAEAYEDSSDNMLILRYRPEGVVGVSAVSRPGWRVDYLRPRNRPYTDRTYTFTAPLPAWLKEAAYLQGRNAEKDSLGGSSFLSFQIDRPATVLVALDERITPSPAWLAGWHKRAERLTVSDSTGPGRVLYEKHFGSGKVSLGANHETGLPTGYSMYSVIVVPEKNGAEDWAMYP